MSGELPLVGEPGGEKVRLIKVIMVGNSNVGKTSIVERFSSDSFAASYIPTIGIDFVVQELIVEEAVVVKLHVWDTAGSEKFDAITRNYYHVANAAMVVFDLCDRRSFDQVPKWLGKLRNNCADGTPVLLLGNKCDLTDRVVTEAEAVALAEKLDVPFLPSSARTNYNIYKAFFKLTKLALLRPQQDQATKLHEENANKPGCRC